MAAAAVAVLAAALCLSAGTAPLASVASVATTQFTLRRQHSIEKIVWEEDYVVAGGARIRGSGAGMEPPPDAVLQAGVWHYRVADPWRRALVLARSEFVRDYELCVHENCQPLSHWIPVAAGTTTLQACRVQKELAAPTPMKS